MSTYERVALVTLPIAAAVLAYRFQTLSSPGGVAANPTAAGRAPYLTTEAVTAEQYNAGEGQTEVSAVDVSGGGVAKVEAGATLAVGATVSTDVNGRAVAGGAIVLGVVKEGGAAGDIISVQLTNQ